MWLAEDMAQERERLDGAHRRRIDGQISRIDGHISGIDGQVGRLDWSM